MEIRWVASRPEDGVRMPPMLAALGRRRWVGIRFGRQQQPSFSERYQGTRGIPIIWYHFLGGRLSVTVRPVPDDRRYLRFGTTRIEEK